MNERLHEGSHKMPWDGRDDQGRPAAAGVYFVRLCGERSAESTKVMLVK